MCDGIQYPANIETQWEENEIGETYGDCGHWDFANDSELGGVSERGDVAKDARHRKLRCAWRDEGALMCKLSGGGGAPTRFSAVTISIGLRKRGGGVFGAPVSSASHVAGATDLP